MRFYFRHCQEMLKVAKTDWRHRDKLGSETIAEGRQAGCQ